MSAPSPAERRARASGGRLRADPVVFGGSAALVGVVLAGSVLWTERARRLFLATQDWIADTLGWFYLVSVAGFLLFALWLGLSRHGSVRLGRDGEAPEFGALSWFAMLFSAGMGIGMMFYGVAEPVLHYGAPPDATLSGPSAARSAMALSFLHWSLHAWGIYIVLGAALAYFHHRLGRPLAIRSALEPLLGARAHGVAGRLVDVVAVFGTLFGLATSLGLGAMQVNAGLAHLAGIDASPARQVLIIATITAAATASLVSGLGRGIRRLSELNLALACLLLGFVLLAGPTRAVVGSLPGDVLGYAATLGSTGLGVLPVGDTDWEKSWTVFYWAWWLAWAPFVGMFIARISRGRTLREFVLGVLLVPSAVTFLWFGVFGGTALHMELRGAGGIAAAVDRDVATAIYEVLARLPWSHLSSGVAVLVVATFFVTSSDSGSFVVDVLTSGGHPDPPIWQRVFWAVTEGVVAAVLLLAGGLRALQSAAINTGLPFAVVLVLVCIGLARALRAEPDGNA